MIDTPTTAFDDPSDAPASEELARLERIRAAFAAANYTVDGVNARLGEAAAEALHRDLLVPAKHALANAATEDALSALIRVYLLAESVREDVVPAVSDQLAAGLLARDPQRSGSVRARVDIRPYAVSGTPSDADDAATLDLWVASDLGGLQVPVDQPLRRDHVVGIGPATANLAQLTPRAPIDRALDLGVGMGVQTMHLLSHVRHVVATDISARALAFARFNLTLNAPALEIDPEHLDERVSLRLGDLLEPVQGERFDLIVSNPPFVITPRVEQETAADQYTYRDGGRPGDRLVEELIRNLGDHLEPRGIAVMLGNWEVHADDDTWHTRLESWAPANTDLWVVQRESATPIEYADMWLKDAAENRELTSWRQQFERYLDDFAARQVGTVGMGMLLLHATPEGTRAVRRFESLEHQLAQPLGANIRDAFDADDWLRERADDELLDETFVVAGDVTDERWTVPGAPNPSAMLLRQGGGFRRTFPESTELASFVSVCDGELTGRQIAVAIAALLEIDQAALDASLARAVRDLVSYGFLVPRWM